MRLIAREIHRAFPELDNFDDEKCRRFVTAAQRGKWAMLGRALANITLSTIAFAAVTALGGITLWLITRSDPDPASPAAENWRYGAWLIIVCAAVTGASVLSLVLRDQLLRRRVARFIHARGNCPQCRYNLLGVRVPESLQINCPECGLELEVDEALTELADAHPNAATPATSPLSTAKPRERRLARTNKLDRWPAWYTPKRRKRTLQTLIALVALAVTIPAAWWGWNWYALNAQAKRAAAQRIGLVGIDKISESLNPREEGPFSPGDNAWDHFDRVIALITQSETEVGATIRDKYDPDTTPTVDAPDQTAGIIGTRRGDGFFPDYSAIFPPPSPHSAPGEESKPYEGREANGEFARRMIERLKELGIDSHLEAMTAAKRAVLSMPPFVPADPPEVLFPQLSHVRSTAQIQRARLSLAVREGDLAEFIRVLHGTLGLIRMVERCPFLVCQLVAIGCESMMLNALLDHVAHGLPSPWLEAIVQCLNEAPTGATPWSIVIDAEREYVRDLVRWYFSDTSRGNQFLEMLIGNGSRSTVRLGTYEENMAAIDQCFDQLKALEQSPTGQTRNADAFQSPGLKLLDPLTAGFEHSHAHFVTITTLRAGVRLTIAVEQYRSKHGSPPTALQDLIPEFITSIPPDLLAPDGQFRYRLVPAIKRPDSRPDYLLYSVSIDAIDDNGAPSVRAGQRFFSPDAQPGTDFVFHQPPSTDEVTPE
jgi:TRAP-type C4-dicarboxylate transport system permease small subunit